MADVNKCLPFKAVHSYIAIHVDEPHEYPIEEKIQNEKKDSIFMSKRNILIIQFCLGWFKGFHSRFGAEYGLVLRTYCFNHERPLCNIDHCFNVS